jgi:hypothetical protein
VCTENLIRIDCVTESPNVNGDDRALLPLPGLAQTIFDAVVKNILINSKLRSHMLCDCFKSRRRLEAEILVLRQPHLM